MAKVVRTGPGRWSRRGADSCRTVRFWNPLAAVPQSLFLLSACHPPLTPPTSHPHPLRQVTAQPQPGLKGQETGQSIPCVPMGRGQLKGGPTRGSAPYGTPSS